MAEVGDLRGGAGQGPKAISPATGDPGGGPGNGCGEGAGGD